MSLNANEILEVLESLIGGSITETPLGPGLKINPRDAFLFSAITGATYFENQIYPFTPKGLLKIFYNALDYNFVTGIFDNLSLKNTPHYICERRNYLLRNNKIIVPVEIKSEQEFKSILKSQFVNNTFDHDLLILKVDLSKKGYGLEPLFEYLVCKYFNKLGFITENQIPLSHALGSPDFGGFSINEVQKSVISNNLLPAGFNVIELSMIRDFPEQPNLSGSPDLTSNFIVGEAKTSTSTMELQLRKYLGSGYFDEAIEIHPSKSKSSSADIGMFFLRDKKISFIPGINEENFADRSKKEDYKNWLVSYFNCYLISNYTNDELNLVCNKLLGKQLQSKNDLIRLVKNFDFDTHLNTLKEFLSYGSI